MDKDDVVYICKALNSIAEALGYLNNRDDDLYDNCLLDINAVITGLENKYDLDYTDYLQED